MWIWLAIIGNFILLIILYVQHARLVELHNRLCSIHDANRAAFSENLERQLGYRELEDQLENAMIRGHMEDDERRHKLRSLFPRIVALEVCVTDLKSNMETVFDINNLRNLDSLTAEEIRNAWKFKKEWP